MVRAHGAANPQYTSRLIFADTASTSLNYIDRIQVYNAGALVREYRLSIVTNTSTSPNRISKFIYDGDGNRVMQIQIAAHR